MIEAVDEISLEAILRKTENITVIRKGAILTADDIRELTVADLRSSLVIINGARIIFGKFSSGGVLRDYMWRDAPVRLRGIEGNAPAFEFLMMAYNLTSLYDQNFGWEY